MKRIIKLSFATLLLFITAAVTYLLCTVVGPDIHWDMPTQILIMLLLFGGYAVSLGIIVLDAFDHA